MRGAWYTHGDGEGAVGGGIFAKTEKTPPLQSGVCGDAIACRIAILVPSIATLWP